ncbi:MAG TPA: flagellar biosynthesis protein FliQ [Luteimonas sp.]|nr:flagellar biosynthesis protein FliQ [Luteimonas sp.]
MDSDTAMRLLAEALMVAVKVSAPFLIVTLIVGLLVSILQVVTQVQEMTLTFVPKLIAVGLVCLLLGSWMLAVMVEFAIRMFETAGSF